MRFTVQGSDGQNYPAELETLREWARSGRVTPTQNVFDETGGAWKSANTITELSGYFAPPVATAAAGRKVGCGAAVALGLVSVMFFMWGMPIVGLIAGIGAVIALVISIVS